MKKLLMFLMTLLVGASGAHAFTVYFDNSVSNWDKVCVYHWSENSSLTTTKRQHTEMTNISGDIWSLTLSANPGTIIFTDGHFKDSDKNNQTTDVKNVQDGHLYGCLTTYGNEGKRDWTDKGVYSQGGGGTTTSYHYYLTDGTVDWTSTTNAFTDNGDGTYTITANLGNGKEFTIYSTDDTTYNSGWRGYAQWKTINKNGLNIEGTGADNFDHFKPNSDYTNVTITMTPAAVFANTVITFEQKPTEANVYLRKYNSGWNTGDKFERQADGITYVLNNVDMADGWYKIYDENQVETYRWKGYDSAASADDKNLISRYSASGDPQDNNFQLKDQSKKVNITYWDNTGTFKIEQVSGSDPGSSSLFPLPTDATITVKGSTDWDSKITGTYNEATGCFEFNVDYPADTQFAFTYNGNDYTNREDLSEDTWSTNAVGRGTDGQNFKTTSAANKIIIDNTTGKVKYVNSTESKPTPENFGILVGSDPNFENSLKFIKATDGSNVWTLTAENVQINNGSAIYVLDNNSNRWWIAGQNNFRIYGDVIDKALTNAGTTPAPARFHMASATYTINAQITMAEDGTYNLDYVKFTRKKGTVTTPDGWQWGLAFQDLNVSGEWSWGQIEANIDKVPLFELSTAAGDGAKAYIFKKTLTLKQEKFFSIYSKDPEGNVKQMNFGPNSTNYDILNNRNLLRLHESNKANKFGLGTADYEVTMEVWQEDNETWYCRFEFAGNAEPNTIYLALSKETPKAVLDADKAKLSIYAYTNGSDATNAITNGNWPGLKEWTLDQTITDVVGVPVYKATVMPRFLRFIASVDGANQTNNLKIVNNGVYFWNDELLPFGVILYGDNGKPVYRRYSDTQSEETTKYVYLPASEFGITKNEDGTYPPVYVNVYDKTTGQQVSGLRGTTKAIPEEYHGVLYYKVPTASIAEGSEIEIEFSRDGGEDNNWNFTCPHCGKTYSEAKDHSACYEECIAGTASATDHTCSHSKETANKIIITYPATETVTFEEGKVFHRYPAKPTNILTDTKPTTLKLCINGEEKDATREDNGTYYFDGEYAASTPYYFKATFGTDENATTSYYGAAAADYQQFKTVPYSIYEVAKTKSANSWLLPTDEGFTFNVVLSWSEQKTWSRINATKAFGSLVGAQDPIDAVPYASAERTAIAATYTSHASFVDETKHFGKTTVSMIHPNKSEYVRPAHTAAVDPATEDNSDEIYTKSGVIKVAAHSAGIYTLRVTNPTSAEFDLQVLETEVTVRPTIESVGLQINGYDVEKENGAYTIFLKDDGEDEFEMNGYTHSNKRAHVGCSEELIAHKTGLPDDSAQKGQMIWDAMKACNIKVYFKYADAAADEPAYRPAAREAAAASTVPAGYTEYGARGVELDMTKAKANGGISFIIEENGVQSTPVTISAANFSVPTGIDEIGEEEAAEPVYFDLQGFPVKNPEKGIYIRVINGKADKVLF